MPVLAARARLDPGPPPDAPPWRWLDTATVRHWLGVSGQTLDNWVHRRTGPAWRRDRARRRWYRLCDVIDWLAQSPSSTFLDQCRAYLDTHRREAMVAVGKLRGSELSEGYQLFTQATGLDEAGMNRLAGLLDRGGMCGRIPKKPARFVAEGTERELIGYGSAAP